VQNGPFLFIRTKARNEADKLQRIPQGNIHISFLFRSSLFKIKLAGVAPLHPISHYFYLEPKPK